MIRMKIDRNFEIYVMDADGGNPARLTDDPLVDASAHLVSIWKSDCFRIQPAWYLATYT